MPVLLTEIAAREVKNIVEQQYEAARQAGETPKPLYLRVGVKGGGCSGFSYALDLTENMNEEADEHWQQDGVDIVCDSKSLLYLDGTRIDFKDEVMGRGFVFQNPNATSTCGCGSSFSA